MRYQRTAELEIASDGRTVWINVAAGNIGRFNRRAIDVHTTIDEQTNGAPQCLACSHGNMHLTDWRQFQYLMLLHYHVGIDDSHMPNFIREEFNAQGSPKTT